MSTALAETLLGWYAANKRDLPWRQTSDPYAIWIAEIMLQQTRVDSVIPYFQRWMEKFPNIASVATSTQQEVLKLWEGLGYYARARNIYKTAQLICEQHACIFPADYHAIKNLPGVGKASAADIASIAFGKDVCAVDGNIRRVVSRLADLSDPLGSDALQEAVEGFVECHLPNGKAGDYNQAWMDLGATVCLPGKPFCDKCPLTRYCVSYSSNTQTERPVRIAKPAVPVLEVAAGILKREDGAVLITRRPEDGLLGGMWEFPGGKREAGEDLPTALQRELQEELGIVVDVRHAQKTYRHAYTHFKVILTAYYCDYMSGEFQALGVQEYRWVPIAELLRYPMGKIDRMISRELLSDAGYRTDPQQP